MPKFKKESLEKLREKIDLVEVLSSHMELKRAGGAYKGLCPFHEEKTPSFTVQRGDTHYHCFGCGAHGDALQFLMEFQHLSFVDAVEALAEKFHIPLERTEKMGNRGVPLSRLREALETATLFFHTYLLHTPEGHQALAYLYERQFSLDFLRRFSIGFAPEDGSLFRRCMEEKKFSDRELLEAGLLTKERKTPFFRGRITFPIKNATGSVIGFSARKIKEETFGGKYINTTETPLFKKSKILFGLDVCRRNLAKTRSAIIVEGQTDCLRLIDAGLNTTVAALGTAFGEKHVAEIKNLGVLRVDLLFDADKAGAEAAFKTGNLFQSVGIEVKVVSLPPGYDPDAYFLKFGLEKLKQKLTLGTDYLQFAIHHLGKELNATTPAGKNALIRELKRQIEGWEEPVMVHESLKKVAHLLALPEEVVGVTTNRERVSLAAQAMHPQKKQIDPRKIVEMDLLRWLVLQGDTTPNLVTLAATHLSTDHFTDPLRQRLFAWVVQEHKNKEKCDLLALVAEEGADELTPLIEELMTRKLNPERAEQQLTKTIQELLDFKWMAERHEIQKKISSGNYNDEEVLALVKQFDALKRENICL